MNYSQENRLLVIHTPLGPDALRIERFEGRESISGLFRFELGLLSTEGAIDPKKIVGQGVAFAAELPNHDGQYRWFHGFVQRFSYLGADDRQHHYAAEVVPWLWFATQNTDCRIFQDKTVLDIVKQVLGDYSADFETLGIAGKHEKLENCVQYRESDFDFVSRLLEREGLFYYFRHEETKHTMVISDSTRGYATCLESSVNWSQNMSAPAPEDDLISWEHRYEYRAGKVALDDYNFKTPTSPLLASTSTIVKLERNKDFELYDYPGGFEAKGGGDAFVKLRMEEQERAHDVVLATGKCRSFTPGGRFTLAGHHNPNEEGKGYVITTIRHSANMGGSYSSGGGGDEVTYQNEFTCIPDSTVFRPDRATPRPIVRGIQTAVVVGKPEEIQVDEFGRIRVQFRWDRYGKQAHDASCWMRVVQPMAGSGWGFQFLPRVGQEVVVEFVEGDPDRPVCTGALYHAEHMPPYKLPDHKTMSGIKMQNTPGGGGGKTANELRFEDKKGEEQIFVHGEKQLDVRVKKSAFEWIGENRHLIVKQDQFEHVENDRHEIVDANHVENVKGDHNLKVGGKQAIEVATDLSLKVGGNVAEKAGQNLYGEAGMNVYVKAGMNLILEAGVSITLKAGASSIVIDPAGVTITGAPQVVVDGAITRINSGPGSPAMAGTPGTIVPPADPKQAQEADEADPDANDKAKADQRQKKGTKYGPTPPKPHKRPSSTVGNTAAPTAGSTTVAPTEKPKDFVAIELKDVDGEPVPGVPYRITLPDGSAVEGTLDGQGKARVDGIDPGSCKVTFPTLDARAWKPK